jgi:hypothetical protein
VVVAGVVPLLLLEAVSPPLLSSSGSLVELQAVTANSETTMKPTLRNLLLCLPTLLSPPKTFYRLSKISSWNAPEYSHLFCQLLSSSEAP